MSDTSMTAASADRAAPKGYAGRVEQIVQGMLHGWVHDVDKPGRRVAVEILVDGQVVATAVANRFRGDLQRSGVGDGRHGFLAAVPRRFFDGAAHDVTARVAGTRLELRYPLLGHTLDPAAAADVRAAVTAVSGARIEGYAFDANHPDRPVQLDLTARGHVIDSLSAARPARERPAKDRPAKELPAKELPDGAPEACGFVFDLLKHPDVDPLDTDLAVVVAGTDEVLPAPVPHLGRGMVEVVVDTVSEEEVRGTIRVPFAVPAHLSFDVYRDGLFAGPALPQPRGAGPGATLFPFVAHADGSGDARTTVLTVCVGGTQAEVGGTPRTIVIPSRGNLLDNGSFARWSGRLPAGWEVAADLRDGLQVGHCRIEAQSEADHIVGSLAPWFDLSGRRETVGGGAGGWLLRQPVDLERIPDRLAALDLLVAVRAAAAVPLTVRLEAQDEGGEPLHLQARVTAWPQWSLRAARLILPPTLNRRGGGTLSIALGDDLSGRGVPDWIAFGAVGLGVPGFRLQAPLTADAPPVAAAPVGEAPRNAVLNGDFARWTHGLRFRSAARRVETADGWVLASPAAGAACDAEIEKLVTRDVARGLSGEEAFGIRLTGEVPDGSLRLETVLDKMQLRFHWDGLLRFYARTASTAASPAASPASIDQILILERVHGTGPDGNGGFTDRTVAVLARRVPVRPSGQYVEQVAAAADVETVRRLAGRFLSDPTRQCILAFTFARKADCVLADVALCPRPESAPGRRIGYVGLEDRNIAAQVGRLRMVEHWDEARRFPAPPQLPEASIQPEMRPEARPETRWSWPAGGLPSADIVICVHNAVDEVVACLDSIRRCTPVPHTVTLVDDGSDLLTRSTLDAYVAARPWMRMIVNPENVGYTRSANIGMARSTADWVVLLNSDTIVTPGWLEGLFACALSDPAIRMVGPLSNAATHQSVPDVLDARGKWAVNALPDGMDAAGMAALVAELSPRAFPRVPLLNGFCTLIGRKALDEVGYLDEAAFPVGYGEENDLCIRMAKAGYQLAIADQVYVYHVKSASFGSVRRDDLARQGTERCKAKHPDVDLRALQAVLSECTPLIELRQTLRRRLAASPFRRSEDGVPS